MVTEIGKAIFRILMDRIGSGSFFFIRKFPESVKSILRRAHDQKIQRFLQSEKEIRQDCRKSSES